MDWVCTVWVVLGVILLVSKLLRFCVPPPLWYFSFRKRRAMRMGLAAFAHEHQTLQASWPGSWVYRMDSEKCVVFVQHRSELSHPNWSGYVVWHDREAVDHIGISQFRFGTQPHHLVERYESVRSRDGGWPAGSIGPWWGKE